MHPALRVRADRRLGVFSAAEAVAAGYGREEIRHLHSSGQWVRLRQGVYITAAELARTERSGHEHRVACLAVALALGRQNATISHASAARLWRFVVPRTESDVVRLTDPERWRRGAGFVMARAPLGPGEVWRLGELRVTAAARTLVDCAREWSLEDAVIAMDAAILAERTTADALVAGAAAIHGWPGAARAVRAAGLANGRAESPLETRSRLRMLGAGLPPLELQVEIRTAGRLIGVVDGWFEEAAVAIECDGRVKYTDPWRGRTPERVLWEEKRREDELRALDIRVVRLADPDVGSGWPAVEARLRRLLVQPGPAHRSFTATPRVRGRLRTA